MLGLSVIILFNLIFNVNSNLAESSANCSAIVQWLHLKRVSKNYIGWMVAPMLNIDHYLKWPYG